MDRVQTLIGATFKEWAPDMVSDLRRLAANGRANMLTLVEP